MRMYKPNGSKERLFEMMERVNKLDEGMLSKNRREIVVSDFIDYVREKLELQEDIPNIELSYNEGEAQAMKSFGRYMPESNVIVVIAVNRNLADILRTIAHELIHLKQDEDGRLKPNSGETGSEEENEANALAGVFMREYGRNNPIIFE